MKHTVTILDAIRDKQLFAPWFKDEATWRGWQAFLAALFALPMTREQASLYQQCTGRTERPVAPASEGWLVCGRRAGKSFMLALIAVFLACFGDWRPYLAPGERGTVMVIATDRKQARVIFRYIGALLGNVPMLARMIERETVEAFDLNNGVSIEVQAASYRSTRGYTIVAALCDEIAFWPTDNAAEPDYEIINALLPGMATIPGAMLLCASSPYARRGALWDAYHRHHGKNGDPILVWQADTRTMNPTVPQQLIDKAMERDPSSASAEYGAQFRRDIESFVNREAVDACVAVGVHERAPVSGVSYVAFVDPSGGSANSMTLAIGHKQDDVSILDAVRECKPPFSPEDVVAEFAALLKRYAVSSIRGDRYAGEWPRERFREHGITYEASTKPKSDLYRDMLPAINSRQVELLDDARLIGQIVGLERRTARGGRDSIDHAPGAHDDLCNAVAGIITSELGSSAEAWIKWAAKQSAAAWAEEGVSEPDRRSVVTREEANSLIEAHDRFTGKWLASKPECAWCGGPLGGSRATDGKDAYHPECYRAQTNERGPSMTKPTKETMMIYKYKGFADVPTRVAPGDGKTYDVIDGCFTAPARFASYIANLGFRGSHLPRVRPQAEDDQSSPS